jgi:cytochrome c556
VAQAGIVTATQGVARKEEAMHHGRAAWALSAVAVVAVLSGCGGSDTTAQFKSGYNSVRIELNQTGRAIAQEISQTPRQNDAQVSASFRSLAQRFSTQVAKLTALKPPSSVAAEWHNVTDAAIKLDSDLSKIASDMAAHDTSAAQQAATSLAANAKALQQAITPIKQKLGLK